jgi:fatty acid desaturase
MQRRVRLLLLRGLELSEQRQPIPRRFDIVRRWQWMAAAASAFFFIACFIGWPLGYFWPSAIGFLGFLPSVWVFSIKCYSCGWPAFTDYEAEEKLRRDDRFWSRFWGKEYGGVNLPLPRACSKCGACFVD